LFTRSGGGGGGVYAYIRYLGLVSHKVINWRVHHCVFILLIHLILALLLALLVLLLALLALLVLLLALLVLLLLVLLDLRKTDIKPLKKTLLQPKQ
jgi:hypothetical protein